VNASSSRPLQIASTSCFPIGRSLTSVARQILLQPPGEVLEFARSTSGPRASRTQPTPTSKTPCARVAAGAVEGDEGGPRPLLNASRNADIWSPAFLGRRPGQHPNCRKAWTFRLYGCRAPALTGLSIEGMGRCDGYARISLRPQLKPPPVRTVCLGLKAAGNADGSSFAIRTAGGRLNEA